MAGNLTLKGVIEFAQRIPGKGLYFMDAWMSLLSLPTGFGAAAGQIPHFLVRSGEKFVGGRIWGRKDNFPPKATRFFLISEYPDLAGREWFGPIEQIRWVKSWQDALIALQKAHGSGTKVPVIPDGTIQYFF
jgi:hypothetical protein